jgi:cytochrome c oxidase assembly factor CtaG
VAHLNLQPLQLAPALLLALAYALRARELAARGRPVPGRRQAAFYAGIAVIAMSVVSPLDWLAEHRFFYAHMLQHLLLGDIAPLLVVLGLTRALLQPVLAIRVVQLLRPLAHPLVALPLWTVDLYLWHLPWLYQAALRHDDVHALQHALFFGAGALMWAAVIEPVPGPAWFTGGWKAAYVLAVRTAGMGLAQVFIWAAHPFYGYYRALAAQHGTSALTDQRIAGAIMFIEGGVITLVAFGHVFLRLTRESERRQRLLEAGADPLRADRGARYGSLR